MRVESSGCSNLEGDGGKLLVWCVAEVVEHHLKVEGSGFRV
jgi:hypothetical protein